MPTKQTDSDRVADSIASNAVDKATDSIANRASDRQDRLWTIGFITVSLINLCIFGAMSILNNTLPLYVDSLGGNAGFIGMLSIVFAATAIVARTLSGTLTDRVGSRLLMLFGALVFSVATLLFNLVPTIGAVVPFRFLQGFGFAFVNTATSAAAAKVIPKRRMGEGMGYFGLGQALTMAIGPMVGLALVAGGKFTVMFAVTAAVIFTACLLSLVLRMKPQPRENVNADRTDVHADATAHVHSDSAAHPMERGIWRIVERRALPVCAVQFMLSFAVAIIVVFVSLNASRREHADAGLFFLAAAVVMLVTRLFAGKLYDRFGTVVALVPGLFAASASYVLLALPDTMASFLVAGMMYGIGVGIGMPVLNATVIQRVPPHRYGVASATYLLTIDLGIGLGGAFWGFVIERAGFAVAHVGAFGCSLLAALLTILLLRKKRAAC